MKPKQEIAPWLTLLAITGLLVPTFAFAHEGETDAPPVAGTDDYLRHELEYSDEMLATPVANEDREPFRFSTGAVTIDDVLGDVLNRYGISTALNLPWVDIDMTTLTKNDANQTWDLVVTVGDAIPAAPPEKAQLFFLADTDGDSTNNAPDGIRIHMDAEFALQLNQEAGWYTDFRWYNSAEGVWAINKETTATFEVAGNTFSLHIPFTELSGDHNPNWRVIMAASNEDSTEVDSGQDVGFPDPKVSVDQSEAAAAPNELNRDLGSWILYSLLLLGVVMVGFTAIRLLS